MPNKELGILTRVIGAQQASSAIKGVDNAVSNLTGKSGSLGHQLRTGVGNALGTFKGRLEGAGKAALAFAGVGGVLSIGTAIEQSVTKLEDFSLALEKVQTLTGETARDSGTLILLFQKFGLSTEQVGMFAGFAEKTLGKLNSTSATTAKTAKDLTLAHLELAKAEAQAAGKSTKHIDALIKERKAHDAVLAASAKTTAGLTKLQALDKQYGLQLVDSKGKVVSYSQELMQLADFYDRNHDASTRAYVASTLLGRGYASLAPILDQGSAAIRQAAQEADQLGLGNAATAAKMVDFRNTMRDLGTQVEVLQLGIGMALVPVIDKFAHSLSDFITQHSADITSFFSKLGDFALSAAGTIGNVVGALSAAWNSIPAPLRGLLVGAVAGDRLVKFLFGFSPGGLVVHLAGNLLSGLGGSVASKIGGSLAQTLLGGVQKVWVVNPGFGLGGGGAAGAAEAAGGLSGIGLLTALGIGTLIVASADVLGNALLDFFGGKRVGDPGYNPAGTQIPGTPFRVGAAQPYYKDPRTGLPYGAEPPGGVGGPSYGGRAEDDTTTKPILNTRGFVRDDSGLIAAAGALNGAAHSLSAAGQAFANARTTLDERLKHPLLPNSQVNHWLTAADKIAHSSESSAEKLKGLEAIKQKLDAGKHGTVHYVNNIINNLRVTTRVNVAGHTTYSTTRTASQSATSQSAIGGSPMFARAGTDL